MSSDITFKRLANGEWGVGGKHPAPAPGEVVQVATKSGAEKKATIREILDLGGQFWTASIVPDRAASSAPRLAAPAPSACLACPHCGKSIAIAKAP